MAAIGANTRLVGIGAQLRPHSANSSRDGPAKAIAPHRLRRMLEGSVDRRGCVITVASHIEPPVQNAGKPCEMVSSIQKSIWKINLENQSGKPIWKINLDC
jgi:hypothetical protein